MPPPVTIATAATNNRPGQYPNNRQKTTRWTLEILLQSKQLELQLTQEQNRKQELLIKRREQEQRVDQQNT